MTRFVLDASAFLAHVQEEPGWELVEKHLAGAVMSTVNYSEVLKKTIERGGRADLTSGFVRRSRVELVDFDAKQARLVAELWPASNELGLSLGDRACLALGISMSARVLTADRRMAEAPGPAEVVLVREGY